MSISNVPKKYESSANDFSRFNLLSNGGFTGFSNTYKYVKNTNLSFGSVVNLPTDYIDKRQYQAVSFSMQPATEPGSENKLGFWDVYGVKGSVEVAPKDSATGNVIPARDGGNYVRVVLNEKGSIFFDQDYADVAPLRGHPVMVAYSAAAAKGNVTLEMSLLDGDDVVFVQRNESSTFGVNSRVVREAQIPSTTTSLRFRLKLTGLVGSSCLISSVTSVLGPAGNTLPFVPSIEDTVVPAGTVILMEGDSCPPGYQDATAGVPAMVLGTSGQHVWADEAGQAVTTLGSDTHDHNPNGAVDATLPSSNQLHDTPDFIPEDSRATVRTPLFGSLPQFPGEKPAEVLGVAHTHKLRTQMGCVPPSFPVRICIKL